MNTNDDNRERAAVARLAAAYGNTDAGRDTVAQHTDLSRVTAICARLSLQPPAGLTVLPGVAEVQAAVCDDLTRRSVTVGIAIREATLPPTRRSVRISAGDRHGPRLSGLDASDYLAVPPAGVQQLLAELRDQLTAAGAALYQAAIPLHRDQAPAARDPHRQWEPTPAAIDALSDLLEQDARWQAQLMVNDWYVHSIRAVEKVEKVKPGQLVADGAGLQHLPDQLSELLNEHWRAVYTRTVNEALGVIDALGTPGEIAMRDHLDAREVQEAQEARDAAGQDFPDAPGTGPSTPGESPGRPPIDPGHGHSHEGGEDRDR